jgi:predicted aspartyl protease
MLLTGAFDTTGSATLRIKVAGSRPAREFIATIDTGFSGFVALPLHEMISLGLKSEGATSVMLGDGSVVDNLVAPGFVTVGAQTERGSILLDENSTDVLIGMDFLRTFKLGLILTNTAIVLYDEAETMLAVLRFMNTAPAGQPNTSPSST